MARSEHSAIPSWSGYIYQGKVALYHVLKIIEKKLFTLPSFDFNNYDLEIEWQEDFSILIDGVYESIHQVKAYASGTYPTTYNAALDGLFYKLDKGIGKQGWLHIWTNIHFTELTESKNFQELKEANKNSYSQYALDCTNIYKYCSGQSTCDLNEIDMLILEKINKIYELNDFGIDSASTAKQHKAVKFKLFELLDTHILEIHTGYRAAKDTISFNSLLDLFKENYENLSQEYQYIKVKNNFFEKIYKYCNNPYNCSENCNVDCNLYKIEKELEKKSSKEVYKIILQSTPQHQKFEDLFDERGLTLGLIRTFHTLRVHYKTNEYLYKNNQLYLPTTIQEQSNIPNIAKQTFENENLDSILHLYEIDTFISHDVTSTNILKDAGRLKNISEDAMEGLFGAERRNAIDKIKNIQIKPLDDIKGELP